MASKLKVDQIEGQSGTSVEVPTGHTFKVADLGNNKILSTNSSGVVTATSLGSPGQAVKVASSGNSIEFGSLSSDYVKLAETNVTTGVANVSFEHGTGDIDFTSGAYQYFKVFFKDVHMAGDNERIYAYLKASGGSYLSGSNNYRENRFSIAGSSASDLCNVDATSCRIFNGGTDNGRTAYSTMNGELTLMNLDDADNYSTLLHSTHMTFMDSTTNDFFSTGAHTIRITGVHDGIKFEGSGNIERGKFSLYGIK